MSNSNSKLLVVALAGACAFGAWKLGSAVFGDDEAQGSQHLVNQIWIDHMPTDKRDMIQHLVVVDHPEGKFGSVGRNSTWRHHIEVFMWQMHGDTLKVYFPQESVRGAVRARTWHCEGEAPAPFELCLELTGQNGESMLMYSKAEWKIRPQNMAESLEDLADDQPELAGVIEELSEGQVEQLEDFDLEDVRWRDGAPLFR